MPRRGLLALTLLFWASVLSASAPFQAIGPVELERVFEDIAFDDPVFLTSAGDGSGRLFVVEQRGVVHVLASTAPRTDRGAFLDITARVSRARREEGLLGLAFDPAFASNGYFYVYYSAASPRRSVLSRFSVSGDPDAADAAGSEDPDAADAAGSGDPDAADAAGSVDPDAADAAGSVDPDAADAAGSVDPDAADAAGSSGPDAADATSELVLLEVPQPFSNHNGGMIAFGPDGFLYGGVGDGGSGGDPQGNGQDLGTLLGSILRIDVRGASAGAPYRVPPDNPFVGVDGARDEIWAYGLRNPWRFSFDPATGDLWAADVGQADREEIDLVLPGRNYGWNTMEGTNCFLTADCDRTGLEPPVVEYGHGLGCSVTGGYVYRGAAVPALSGVYVYADFCTGRIWGFRPTDLGVSGPVQLLQAPFQVSSFGTDSLGELYVLGFDGGVYRFVGDPVAPPAAPTPTATPAQATPPGAAPTPTQATLATGTTPRPTQAGKPPVATPTPTAVSALPAPEARLEGGRARGAVIAVLIASGAGVLSFLYLVRRRRLGR